MDYYYDCVDALMYIAHNRLPHTMSALKLKLVALEASSSMYILSEFTF